MKFTIYNYRSSKYVSSFAYTKFVKKHASPFVLLIYIFLVYYLFLTTISYQLSHIIIVDNIIQKFIYNKLMMTSTYLTFLSIISATRSLVVNGSNLITSMLKGKNVNG